MVGREVDVYLIKPQLQLPERTTPSVEDGTAIDEDGEVAE